MQLRIFSLVTAFLAGAFLAPAQAGPYDPQIGYGATEAISKDDPRIIGWATSGTITRGPQYAQVPTGPAASFGTISEAYGIADASSTDSRPVVSLGDGGIVTMSFGFAFGNNPGPDFAVFENGIINSGDDTGNAFLELGHVEVSSDGTNFFRFDSISLTQTSSQTIDFGTTDASDLYNLAGKYIAGYGTPFDLEELDGTPGLDINAVTHVRIIDVVGAVAPLPFGDPFNPGTFDSVGNYINDPYATAFETGGFDLDAIAIIVVPEPGSASLLVLAGLGWLARKRLQRS